MRGSRAEINLSFSHHQNQQRVILRLGGKLDDKIVIHIVNWEKFNPRKDVKSASWFRFEHSFFEGTNFDDFSHSEIVAWVWILCRQSRERLAGRLVISPRHAFKSARIRRNTLVSAINKLESLGIIKKYGTCAVREEPARVLNPAATIQHGTETDVTNARTNETKDKNSNSLSMQKEGIPIGGIAGPVLTISELKEREIQKRAEKESRK